MRTLSSAALLAILSQETDEIFVPLLTLDHSSLAAPIPVAAIRGFDPVVSRGENYLPYPFDLTFPAARDGTVSRARLRIDAVDLQIIDGLEAISGPMTASVEIVRLAAPDVVEMSLPNFRIRNTSGTDTTIEGELEGMNQSTEPFPALSFTPGRFWNLF